jgi:hypothetical protein
LLENALSKPGFGRVFALVQRDMGGRAVHRRIGVRAQIGLSGPFVSEPVAYAEMVNFRVEH